MKKCQQQPPDPSGPSRYSEEGESRMRVQEWRPPPSSLAGGTYPAVLFFSFFLAVQHVGS